MIEIMPVGGYREIGKNCTAIKVDDEVVILDMGLHMQNYIQYTDDGDFVDLSFKKLIEVKAVPDISIIENWIPMVKAICVSHAHLDHVGAVPFLASKFKCPIHGSRFTIAVLEELIVDKELRVANERIAHDVNSIFKVSDNIKIEFISVTHSTPQSVMIAVHTKHGVVLYVNDFKLDNTPVLGNKTNYDRIEKMEVKCLIMNSLYTGKPIKTPSEAVARELLKEVMLNTNSDGKVIIISTFSSHIARLKSIIEFSKQLDRKIVFLGRSIDKYVRAAESVGLAQFTKDVKLIRYGSQIQEFLKKCKNPTDYVFVVTGHQGEPKSVLAKMLFKGFYRFKKEDIMIFSCTIIPCEDNIRNREKMESELKRMKVRIFRDIHVSGHGSREDARDMINIVKPQFLIPTHSDIQKVELFLELAEELGYRENKNVFIIKNGQKIKL